jgi:hypothetical protein
MRKLSLTLASMLFLPALSFAATPTIDELYKTIQQQQVEIDALKTASTVQDEKINSTADAIEFSSKSYTKVGGYAELHYNNLNDQGPQNADKKELDIHRFVAFISHEFNRQTRFFSEFEIEHGVAGEGKKGEVEVEQAYVEYDITPEQHAKAGVFLVPVGIINETHEPDTFYGVERNPVESNIIPTTWWEGGFGFNGLLGAGFSYDVAVTSGLYLDTNAGKYKVRDGRQKASEAKAEDLAATFRVKYTGIKGLEVGLTTQYQEDVTQGTVNHGISAVLVETHAIYQIAGFGIKALYANWNIQDDINSIKQGAAQQTGYYIEPSYKINDSWGVFVRGSQWDNLADGVSNTGFTQINTGVNYWIHPQVALKFDYQDQQAESNNEKELDGVNLGVGLSF